MDFKQLLGKFNVITRDSRLMLVFTLSAALQSGDVTSLEAVTTYIGLSLAAHEKTNCVTMYIKVASPLSLPFPGSYLDIRRREQLTTRPSSGKNVCEQAIAFRYLRKVK